LFHAFFITPLGYDTGTRHWQTPPPIINVFFFPLYQRCFCQNASGAIPNPPATMRRFSATWQYKPVAIGAEDTKVHHPASRGYQLFPVTNYGKEKGNANIIHAV
jgi:hypothetical protein